VIAFDSDIPKEIRQRIENEALVNFPCERNVFIFLLSDCCNFFNRTVLTVTVCFFSRRSDVLRFIVLKFLLFKL
jgi:hypothetical protein